MNPRAVCLILLLCVALAACGGRVRVDAGQPAAIECAPFARALTGLALSGAAADWWPQAQGRYGRSRQPEVGAVLVFGRSGRLPSGHVAVVSQVVSRRQILVTSANWLHHRVTEDQPVQDVSADGDWSVVRVWWPLSGQMGTTDYGVLGFIRPDRPSGHDRIVAATPGAIRLAEQGR